jgi:hypothetical protein
MSTYHKFKDREYLDRDLEREYGRGGKDREQGHIGPEHGGPEGCL